MTRIPSALDDGGIFLVLYVNAEWFAPDAENSL